MGKTKATTAGAGMKFSQALSAWGVPAGATVTAVSVALDKKCVTAPGSAIGSGSFNTKLNLNAGASTNTGPTQTLSTTADSVWTTLATGSNAALSGLSDSTLTHLLEVDILYTLSTTSSALTSTTWQIDWDNVVVTITYTINVPGAPGTPTGTQGNAQVPLSWSDNANNGGAAVTDHHVYIYDAASGGSLLNTIDTASASASYTATGLTNGLNYYFEVTASNSAGESAHSTRSAAVVPTALSRIQETRGGAEPGTFSDITTAWTVAAGDLLLGISIGPDADTGINFTDSIGNIWSTGPTVTDGTNRITIGYVLSSVAGATPSFDAASQNSVSAQRTYYVVNYHNATTTRHWAFDTSGSASGASPQTASATTSLADELAIAVGVDVTGFPAAPWVAVDTAGAPEPLSSVREQVGVAVGTYSALWSGAGNIAALTLAFETLPNPMKPNAPILQAVKRASLW